MLHQFKLQPMFFVLIFAEVELMAMLIKVGFLDNEEVDSPGQASCVSISRNIVFVTQIQE